jgi:hypothetical protein
MGEEKEKIIICLENRIIKSIENLKSEEVLHKASIPHSLMEILLSKSFHYPKKSKLT